LIAVEELASAPPLPFSSVNRPARPGYVAGLQRHHLLPRSLTERACFAALFAALGPRAGLHDFRRNGLLLPASEAGAVRMALPLHRGPHRDYTAMAAERLGAIESEWSRRRGPFPVLAYLAALAALDGLQAKLRRNLLDPRRSLRLNRADPLGAGADFTQLDAMAEALWGATQPGKGAVLAESSARAA